MGLFKSKATGTAPPPPPLPSLPATSKASRGPQSSSAQTPNGSIRLGVEMEFLISARRPVPGVERVEEFSRLLAKGYNQALEYRGAAGIHPRMHNAINESFTGERFSEWSMEQDSTIVVAPNQRSTWALEAISPILCLHAGSSWRSHVEVFWDYLLESYSITANSSCGTHVHVSVVGGYSLSALKSIAKAILHFEPAFEAILPSDRLGNEYSKSNWIDNTAFAYRNLSREASIASIDVCQSHREVILLMNPPDARGEHDKMFGWNFLNLLQSNKGTIEFRRGGPSTRLEHAFTWIEIAVEFIQASMQVPNILTIPANVKGLASFLRAANLSSRPGEFKPQYVQALLGAVDPYRSIQPRPVGVLSAAKRDKLTQKKEEDKDRNLMLSKAMYSKDWA